VRRNLAAIPGWVWPLAVFAVAIAPRLPGLRLFLTTDEPFFAGQAADVVTALLRGDFAATYWHFYPGLTISWLDGLGLALQWGLTHIAGPAPEPFTQFIRRDILELLVALRVPYALLTALYVVAIYWLVRRLADRSVALVGALFVACDPFVLAHSRVAHGDGPVMVFMGVAVLAFAMHLHRGVADNRPLSGWLILSAVCGGLAALTKSPGPFVAPFVILVGLGDWAVRRLRRRRAEAFGRCLAELAIWGALASVVFVGLWPALWVEPVAVLGRMIDETFGKVEAGHLVFFMGRPTLDPGVWFYPYVIAFRLTPVIWVGLLASVVAAVWSSLALSRAPAATGERQATAPQHTDSTARRLVVVSGLFVVGLLLFGLLSPKKQDRYLLALFPFLDLLAAWGLVWCGRRLLKSASRARRIAAALLGIILVVAHAYPVLTVYPYYLAYFNPLLGGLSHAVDTTLVGWGEGMEQVADYLNLSPTADRETVAAVPVQTLLPYFRGSGENFYTNDVALRADRVVLYVSQVQRLAPSPEIVRHFRALEPEYVVTVLGVPYAWVYPGPKAITTSLPPEAVPFDRGFGDDLRLTGYTLDTDGAEVSVTLFWRAARVMATDYSISVRLVGADGRRLAQHDGWPVDNLLPTHQLRAGDFVRDVHRLELPAGAQFIAVEVVVYDAASGEAAGGQAVIVVNQQDTSVNMR
jgi:hypothetical protein